MARSAIFNSASAAVYLHGLASSPRSTKAQAYARELERHGVGYSCPDLNLPEFETLTVTRMLAQTRTALGEARPGPVVLIGSSLGAFVAVHAAARAIEEGWPRRVDRMILLAPALDFGGDRSRQIGDRRVADWRETGKMRVMHEAWDEWREVGYQLYRDARHFDAFALPDPVPTLIVQGRQDASVDPAMVEAWASARPSVKLILVDDEHRLGKSWDVIWRESQRLLGLSDS